MKKPMICGMIHLPPLVGYPGFGGVVKTVKYALRELKRLESGGVSAVMVENENDQPHQVQVGTEIVALMTVVTSEVVRAARVRVGVEVLLNDPKASLAIAKASGAGFIRTDYWVDRMSRPEYGGEMEIDAKGWVDYRREIGAGDVEIWADVQVKYAQLLERGKSIGKSVEQAFGAGADAVVVTGNYSGDEPDLDELVQAKKVAGKRKVYVGSGLDEGNVGKLLVVADGAIVGTSVKSRGRVSESKVRALMEKVKNLID